MPDFISSKTRESRENQRFLKDRPHPTLPSIRLEMEAGK